MRKSIPLRIKHPAARGSRAHRESSLLSECLWPPSLSALLFQRAGYVFIGRCWCGGPPLCDTGSSRAEMGSFFKSTKKEKKHNSSSTMSEFVYRKEFDSFEERRLVPCMCISSFNISFTAPELPGERRLTVESHSKVVKYFPFGLACRSDQPSFSRKLHSLAAVSLLYQCICTCFRRHMFCD